MQSLKQYRQLRQQVHQDILNGRPHNQNAAVSTSDQEAASVEEDAEAQSIHGSHSEKTSRNATDQVLPGVTVLNPDTTIEDNQNVVLLVGWRVKDPGNPQNWSLSKKWMTTLVCSLIGIAMTIPTSIEAPSQPAFNEHFGVEPLAGSMTTGIFLIGIGVGSLFAGPFSETFGRNVVYISTLVVVMLFTMAKALAPNYGAAIAFRFLCAIFASAPMTVAGGTIGDVWLPQQIPYSLPFATFCVYSGPVLGPVIGAYTPQISVEFADWISMAIVGATLIIVVLVQPETYSPLLLQWRAKYLRKLTGDHRYHTEDTSTRTPGSRSLGGRLLTNLYRPFAMTWSEPIILVLTFYLVLIYFVLFTFLGGYEIIFTETYDISLSMTYILWVAMLPGQVIAAAMIPYIYALTKKSAAKSAAEGKPLQPEVALYWAMAGASILLPISLFWMAWTCYSHISIWSPIIASCVFGYAVVCIFTSSYQYIIFAYMQYAASALGFMTFTRYVIAGALTPAAIKMYVNLGPHWSLTIVALVATLLAPVPFLLYKYGHKVRAMSKNVQNKA